ncbi:TniQ family protein [Robertmurraya massiliosenegalensis]|uniref:TniQ family protein n=1 Tax=Robertmurraya massiliosenegalensis TaxID=1287657 RepID=UPI000317B502|nr:TniQ family protein [Robertmurraya massiliosenegalensis]
MESRTTLYNIEPIGLGTFYAESLTSYISRLSLYHCLTTGNFVSKLLSPYLDKYYITEIAKRGGNGFFDSATGINGIGTLANDFINVVQLLNLRDDIRKMTLVFWSNTLPTRGLMKDHKAWCTLCLDEKMKKNEIIYDQLLWCIKTVLCCPKHKVYLESRCHNCSKTLKILSRKTKPGYCQYCYAWLGDGSFSSIEPSQVEIQESTLVGQMISYSSKNEPLKFNKNVIADSFQKISKIFFDGNIGKMSKLLSTPETTLRYWIKGINLAPLPNIIRVCLMLKLSVLEFLGIEEIPSEIILDTKSPVVIPKSRFKFDYKEIKEILDDRIKNDGADSLKRVAEIIGCDRKLLYSKFPVESKIIVENHRYYLEHQKMQRQQEINIRLESIVSELINSGEYPSRRVVEELLKHKYFVKESFLREKWIELKNEYLKISLD